MFFQVTLFGNLLEVPTLFGVLHNIESWMDSIAEEVGFQALSDDPRDMKKIVHPFRSRQ